MHMVRGNFKLDLERPIEVQRSNNGGQMYEYYMYPWRAAPDEMWIGNLER